MTEAELRELLTAFESERVERTRAFDNADKMGQAICAFANDFSGSGETGYMLLGVEDDGRISGRRIDDERWASIGGLKTDGKLLPPPSLSMEKFSLSEGDVIVIKVFPSAYPPIRYNGDVWIRVGPRKCKAREDDIRILMERRARFGARDEELPCERAKMGDLDVELFGAFYLPRAIDAQVIEEDDRPTIEQMAALRFYSIEKDCPTRLYGRAKPDNFPFVNDYRNPLLAEAMKVLGVVNKYNRGVTKANRELEKNGNPPAQFDVNKLTEFRVTVLARPKSGTKSGQINPESGQINPESGQINSESGQINSESGQINYVKPYDTDAQDRAVLEVIRTNPGIKPDAIFLEVKTSTRSVRRVLERLSANDKIEYRGSKRTGGWFVKT